MTQFSFASGEISPALQARADLTLYAKGLRTCRNFIVRRDGGVDNRPGTRFIKAVKDSAKKVRLLDFVAGGIYSYVIELGDHYARFYWRGPFVEERWGTGLYVLQTTNGIVTPWSAGVAYGPGAIVTYASKDYIRLLPDAAMTTVPSAGPAYWYELSTHVELPTPWGEADLWALKTTQSADVMTLLHPSYPPYELRRHGVTNFEVRLKPEGVQVDPQSNLLSVTGSWSVAAPFSFGGFSSYNPLTINHNAHGLSVDTLHELSFWLATSAAGVANAYFLGVYMLHVVDANHLEVRSLDGQALDLSDYHPVNINVSKLDRGRRRASLWVDWSTLKWRYAVTSVDAQGNESPRSASIGYGSAATDRGIFTWEPVPGAVSYNVYKSYGGAFGFVMNVLTNTFVDTAAGIAPDFSVTPPDFGEPKFSLPSRHPAVGGYYQQRLFLANQPENPQRLLGSRTGFFDDFSTHDNVLADDALDFVLASLRVQGVKALLDVGRLLVFTENGEWMVGDGSALTPGNLSARQQSQFGSGDLPPLMVGNSVLFMTRGKAVRDIGYDFSSDGYQGGEVSIFSDHLLRGHSIVDWAFSSSDQVVWMVRDDGVLLGLTYVKESQVLAWHRHDTLGGVIESVVSVPEATGDGVYLLVRRGASRFIERMAERYPQDFHLLNLMDSAFTQNRWLDHGSTSLTLTTGAGWTEQDALTVTLSQAFVMAVGDEFHVLAADGSVLRLKVASVVSPYAIYSVVADRTVPVDLRAVAIPGTGWADARPYIGGLQHLPDGTKVSVFADGDVYEGLVKESWGGVVLPRAVAQVTAGLPVTADLETLDVETSQGSSLAGEAKLVNRVKLHILETRGLFVGDRAPVGDGVEGLTELKLRDVETYDDVKKLYTGVVVQNLSKKWNRNGRVFLRQTKPLPATILSIAPEGLLVPAPEGGMG